MFKNKKSMSKFKFLIKIIVIVVLVNACSTDDNQTAIEQVSVDEVSISNVISSWNTLWLEIDRYATGMRPNATARALAYIHLAGYETAVFSMEGYTTNSGRFEELDINNNERGETINLSVALNSAYKVTIDHFMRNVPETHDVKINELYDYLLSGLSRNINISEDVVSQSNHWGTYVAEQIIAYSETDIEAETQILEPQPLSYVPPIADGYWTFNEDPERALFPYWGSVRTFVISSEETTSVAPSMLYSTDVTSDYYKEMEEVYHANNTAREEDGDALWLAEFWSDDAEGLMMSPPGRQISIAQQLITNEALDYQSSLILLLKLGFSLNDAAVSTWADKYEYMVMRPSAYIKAHMDPDFQTNLYRLVYWPNPSFPGYPSGHSTFASAAAGLFIDQFGDIAFTDRTHNRRYEFRGLKRSFETLTEMAEENAFSRIPLGVHIRMDCVEGLRLGYEISDAVKTFNLQ